MRSLLPITLLCLLLAACNSKPVRFDESWLDTQTTRRQVLAKLGPPARFLDRNRVMAYRICGGEYADEMVCANTVGYSDSSLIIAFDNRGLYLQHQLVRLNLGDKAKP